ncbi:hypothetical protein [Oligoflexus tunisiensis]|uniref:hypothetical protein n=1 Tax=Oligoflexus tunisiensis TaxID=708132 RepID=UPI00159F165D|nr:hypothetical protein [Oligoflexus tunisiensis]
MMRMPTRICYQIPCHSGWTSAKTPFVYRDGFSLRKATSYLSGQLKRYAEELHGLL